MQNKTTSNLKHKKLRKRKAQGVVRRRPLISKLVEEEFIRFREYHSPKRFSKNLRNLLIDFLMFEGAIESNYLQDLLYDMQGLFELLEAIQSESEEAANANASG